jgi:adenylate kinase
MTREEIIRMAQEAQMPFYWRTGEITYLDKLERFAALVASAEREACVKIVEDEAYQYASPVWAFEIVNDIKARGQA